MHDFFAAMLDSVGKEYRYAIQRRDIMSYAKAWLKWFPTIERGAAGLNERMAAHGHEGDRSLCVAQSSRLQNVQSLT